MSSYTYAKSDIIDEIHCDQGDKRNLVDIYVSAESLRVYDNPWVEETPQSAQRSMEVQQPTGTCFYFFVWTQFSFIVVRAFQCSKDICASLHNFTGSLKVWVKVMAEINPLDVRVQVIVGGKDVTLCPHK